jgi:hypothetical protein
MAELRYQIRLFLRFSENAARQAGIEPQQHQLLLAIKGSPRRDSHRIVGYLGRSNLMTAHLRQLEEEHIRERRFPRRQPTESNILG